jgi:hypothetical protein
MAVVQPSVPEPHGLPASVTALRAHADQLRALAARCGIADLKVAGPGRLVGTTAAGTDALDVAEFELEASSAVGGEVRLFSSRVLGNPGVSPDLTAASPL